MEYSDKEKLIIMEACISGKYERWYVKDMKEDALMQWKKIKVDHQDDYDVGGFAE